MNKEKKIFLLTIFILISLTDVSVLLSVYIIQQFCVILFLAIIPGLLIIEAMRIAGLTTLDKFLLSIGISVSFQLIFGVFLNFFLNILGFAKPLDFIILLTSLNVVYFLLLGIVAFTKGTCTLVFHKWSFNSNEKLFLSVPVFFPVFMILGMYFINDQNFNAIFIGSIILMIIYLFVFDIFYKGSNKLYPIILFLISITLILIVPFSSQYLIGADLNYEFYFFLETITNHFWQFQPEYLLGTTPSISLLPAIFQSLMDVDPTILFKFFFVGLYSITPLIVYSIAEKFFQERYAFLASLFYMFQLTYLLIAFQGRTALAILFISLLFLILIHGSLNELNRYTLFTIFSVALVLTHYASAIVFLVMLILIFIVSQCLSKIYRIKTGLNIIAIPIFVIIVFFWHAQYFSTLQQILNFGLYLADSVALFNPTESATVVSNVSPFLVNVSDYSGAILFWLVRAGVVVCLLLHQVFLYPENHNAVKNLIKKKFSPIYFGVIVSCAVFFFIYLYFPILFAQYGIGRVFPIFVMVLSIFSIIGFYAVYLLIFFLFSSVNKKAFSLKHMKNFLEDASNYPKIKIISSILLILLSFYLLGIIGVTPYITGSTSDYEFRYIIDKKNRDQMIESSERYDLYIQSQEFFAANWMKNFYLPKYGNLTADRQGLAHLMSTYGGSNILYTPDIFSLSYDDIQDFYIFLSYKNIVTHQIYIGRETIAPLNNYEYLFFQKNTIYSNGGSAVIK